MPARLAIPALVRAIEWLVIALLAVIVVTVIVEVVIRDLLHLSLGFHEELTRYLMVWVAMLASVVLTSEDGHIRIALLPEALPPRARAVVSCVADLVVLLFLAVFVYACAVNLPGVIGQRTVTLGVDMVWFQAALPVGGLLMLLVALRNAVVHFRRAIAASGA